MRFRTKIILLVIFITVFTTFAISGYVIKIFVDDEIEKEHQAIKNVVEINGQIISDQYYSAKVMQMVNIYYTKRNLMEMAALLTTPLLERTSFPDVEEYNKILSTVAINSSRLGLMFLIYKDQKFIGTDKALELISAKNSKGEGLLKIVGFPTPFEGNSEILYTSDKKYLIYIYASHVEKFRNGKLIIIKDLSDYIEKHEDMYRSIILSIKSSITELNKFVGAEIDISDSDDVIVQSSGSDRIGSTIYFLPKIAHADFKNKDRKDLVCDQNDDYYMCTIYFKPLDLKISATKANTKIISYSKSFAKQMSYVVILLTFIGVILAIIIVGKTTKSLKFIADKAKTIAEADLSDRSVLNKIALFKKDSNYEINKVYEAFYLMTQSLNKNIQDIISVNKAKNRIETELSVAHDIQIGMLPNSENTPKSDVYDIASYLQPAKEVGGDFYDIFRIDEKRIAMTIGDVSDKGVPAAMFMSICVTSLRQLICSNTPISTSLQILNNVLSERNPKMMFVTLFVIIFNEETGEFVYGNAGHCKPYLISYETRSAAELEGLSGPAIGVVGDLKYKEFAGTISKNEYLYLYTDGISEAQNEKKEFFGIKRILSVLTTGKYQNSQDLVYKVLDEVINFRKQALQSDDITMMSIRYHKDS